MEGMCIGITTAVRDHFEQELPTIAPASDLGIMAAPLHVIFLKHHATFGDIFEVPWFAARLQLALIIGDLASLKTLARRRTPQARAAD